MLRIRRTSWRNPARRALAKPERPARFPGGRGGAALVTALLLAVGVACGIDRPEEDPESRGVLAIVGGTVLTSAGADPIEDGVVLVLDGVIERVGPRTEIRIPAGARRVSVPGLFVIPGLWNADVRIPEPLLDLARAGSDEELTEALEERFNRHGFVTIVETATGAAELEPLTNRLAEGQVPGPRILTPGPGLPAGFERSLGGAGAERFDPAGAQTAAARGADLADRGIALLPGLTRASYPAEGESPDATDGRLDAALDEVASFALMGGALVFGTGAGYVPDYDPFPEYVLLDEAGVSSTALFEALTINPAVRFRHDYTGVIEPGLVADLVVVEGDPLTDPTALARVRWVLKEGLTLFNTLR